MFGDIKTGFTGTDVGQYLGLNMSVDSFGNRGNTFDGAGATLTNLTGNQKFEEWYNVSFTWTPTSGTTGNFVATGTSSDSSSNWAITETGFTFDSNEAYFGFGSADYFGSLSVATYDNIEITGTEVPEPGSLALMGLGGLMMLKRRRRA